MEEGLIEGKMKGRIFQAMTGRGDIAETITDGQTERDGGMT